MVFAVPDPVAAAATLVFFGVVDFAPGLGVAGFAIAGVGFFFGAGVVLAADFVVGFGRGVGVGVGLGRGAGAGFGVGAGAGFTSTGISGVSFGRRSSSFGIGGGGSAGSGAGGAGVPAGCSGAAVEPSSPPPSSHTIGSTAGRLKKYFPASQTASTTAR